MSCEALNQNTYINDQEQFDAMLSFVLISALGVKIADVVGV